MLIGSRSYFSDHLIYEMGEGSGACGACCCYASQPAYWLLSVYELCVCPFSSVWWLVLTLSLCYDCAVISALLLLFMEEEATFWLLVCIVEDLLPEYFTPLMLGIRTDLEVLWVCDCLIAL